MLLALQSGSGDGREGHVGLCVARVGCMGSFDAPAKVLSRQLNITKCKYIFGFDRTVTFSVIKGIIKV